MNGEEDKNSKKGKKSRLDIFLEVLKIIVTPLVLAIIGFYLNMSLELWKDAEMKSRIFADIMSRRETAENDLRKDMLKSVIESVLEPKSKDLGTQVTKLELLTYNFHESIDLGSLYQELSDKISETERNEEKKNQYLRRLKKAADEIKWKQLSTLQSATLEAAEAKRGQPPNITKEANITIESKDFLTFLAQEKWRENIFETFRKLTPKEKKSLFGALLGDLQSLSQQGTDPRKDIIVPQELSDANFKSLMDRLSQKILVWKKFYTIRIEDSGKFYERNFRVQIIYVDPVKREVKVKIWASKPRPLDKSQLATSISVEHREKLTPDQLDVNGKEFTIGYYDFPIIDNTRLSEDQRIAFILSNFEERHLMATINFVYFPGSRSSLKEKAYYDDLMSKLLYSGKK